MGRLVGRVGGQACWGRLGVQAGSAGGMGAGATCRENGEQEASVGRGRCDMWADGGQAQFIGNRGAGAMSGRDWGAGGVCRG